MRSLKNHYRIMSFSQAKLNMLRCEVAKPDVYISYLRGENCRTEEDFFREVSVSLQFPWYFGENWPALDDCICDLDWLCFSKLIIIIDQFDHVFMGDSSLQNKLIRHLDHMVNYWLDEHKEIEIWLNRMHVDE